MGDRRRWSTLCPRRRADHHQFAQGVRAELDGAGPGVAPTTEESSPTVASRDHPARRTPQDVVADITRLCRTSV
jgi:hypothetical protein